jgi:transposase
MLGIAPTPRVLVAIKPVDLRRGFNGLYALVQNRLGADPLSGQLFAFTNRQRNRLKILYWDGSGLWVCAKRLEKGTFGWPKATSAPSASITLRAEQWMGLVHGMKLKSRRGWYRR